MNGDTDHIVTKRRRFADAGIVPERDPLFLLGQLDGRVNNLEEGQKRLEKTQEETFQAVQNIASDVSTISSKLKTEEIIQTTTIAVKKEQKRKIISGARFMEAIITIAISSAAAWATVKSSIAQAIQSATSGGQPPIPPLH